MKLGPALLAFLIVLGVGQTTGRSSPNASLIPNQTSTIGAPKVKRIRLKGNKLIVTGENFDDGAAIVINIEVVKTRNDGDSPTTTLIAKKGGKRIPFDGIFDLYVENSDGEPSFPLAYFRGPFFLAPVLPRWPYPFSVALSLGDYLVVRDLETATRWFTNANVIKRVFDTSLPSSAYWLFQAAQPGFAQFYAERYNGGELGPLVLYDTVIIVE